MKPITTFLLALPLLLGCSSNKCSCESTNSEKAQTSVIELNAQNARDYLNIDVSYGFYGYNQVSYSYQGFTFTANVTGASPHFLYEKAKIWVSVSIQYENAGESAGRSASTTFTVDLNVGGNGTAAEQAAGTTNRYNTHYGDLVWSITKAQGTVERV